MKEISDYTTQCIRCGFCLESCPTFRLTGDERESPRGRIYLVRSANEGKLDWQADVRPHMDACLGCRACETACPSGVEYGSIFELARDKMEQAKPATAKGLLLKVLTNPALLRTQLAVGKLWPGNRVPAFVSRMLAGAAPEAQTPSAMNPIAWASLDQSQLPPIRGSVAMLEGCAMRVLYDPVNEATRRLLRRIGFVVEPVDLGCCGALHAHNGHLGEAGAMARALARKVPVEMPIIVNSAGCGSTMKEYAHLDPGLSVVAERTFDLTEFLLTNRFADVPLRWPEELGNALHTHHDACHLAHGQKIRSQPRELLRGIASAEFRELPEADHCCGSAGIYNLLQPKMARLLLDKKWETIVETEASVVTSGNPGCLAWIEQASAEHGRPVRVLHTAVLLEMAAQTAAGL